MGEKKYCYAGCGNEATHELWETEDGFLLVCYVHLVSDKRETDKVVPIFK